MSVSLTIDDLKQPTGELDDAMFPNGDIDNLLSGWLSQAETKVSDFSTDTQDEAAAAWVYYRGFSAIASRMANTAESVTVGPRTERTSASQQKYFADRAAYWFDIYNGLDVVTPTIANPAFFGSVKARRCGIRY